MKLKLALLSIIASIGAVLHVFAASLPATDPVHSGLSQSQLLGYIADATQRQVTGLGVATLPATGPAHSGLSQSQLLGFIADNTQDLAGRLAGPNVSIPSGYLNIGGGTAGALSVNPAITITRNYNTTGNAHGFSDESTFNVSAAGYNSFDAIPNFGAAGVTYDHYAAFQARPKYRGTATNGYGYSSQPEIIGPGGVGTLHHLYIADAQRSGGATLTTQYGITINAFTSTNAISMQSNGATSRMIHNGRIVMGSTSFSGLDPSAMLQINSTSVSGDGLHRGVLLPRMTRANRDAIPTPVADGLVIYQTDSTPGLRIRVGGVWAALSTTADP